MTSHLRHARIAALLVVVAGPVASQEGRSTPEVEPNDAAQTATLARLGDRISGTVNPSDIDYFAVELAAGTSLVLIGAPVPFFWPEIPRRSIRRRLRRDISRIRATTGLEKRA